jgi:hypothetical protein
MLIGIIDYDDNNNKREQEEVRNTAYTCIDVCVSTSTSRAHCIKTIRWLFEGEINRMRRYLRIE